MTVHPVIDRHELLSRHFLLKGLDATTLDTIARYSQVKAVPRGAIIFTKGDPGDRLLGVMCGRVRIFNSGPDDREILLNILEPGALFGEIALIDDQPRTASASALDDCELLAVHRQHFLPLLIHDPQLAIHMLRLLCERARWTTSLVDDAAFLSLPARLAKRLLSLAYSHGDTQPDGKSIRLKVRLSQRQLGAMIDGSREAVNKQIKVWRGQGILGRQDGHLVLCRPDWLEAIVG